MKNESKFKEKVIELELFGNGVEIAANENKFLLCEEIKGSARHLLEQIKSENVESHKANILVEDFLRESLNRLLGEDKAAELFKDREASIPELTGALCHIISELGLGFEYEEEVTMDEM